MAKLLSMWVDLLRNCRRLTALLSLLALVVSCASNRSARQCPFDLQQVLSDCHLAGAAPLQAVLWKREVDDQRAFTVEEVVLAASEAEHYLFVEAYRHPGDSNRGLPEWNIGKISVMYIGGGEGWIIGKRESAKYPTEDDLAEFLKYIKWNQDIGFRMEFEGSQKLKDPGFGGEEGRVE